MKTETTIDTKVTTTASAAVKAGEFKLIPREQIRPSATNPRKQFDPAKLTELAGTITRLGIQQPLLVRRLEDKTGAYYELIAGERRWRAAGEAKLAKVPAIVAELTDAEVIEFQYIENMQREDLSPLEEAEGFARLIATGKYTVDTLVEKLGKSRATIFGRLKLMKLSKPLREALAKQEIDTSMAGLLAQVPSPEMQAKALKEVLKGNWDSDDQPMAFRQAKKYLSEHYMATLKGAPFAVEDAALDKKAGACHTCPKRSGNMKELFPDIGSPDVCTDVLCFKGKKEALFAQKETAARENGQRVMTEKEYQKVYYNSSFVKLDETCYYAKGNPKWGALLKKTDLKPTLARHDGELIEVMAKDQLTAAAKKAGVKFEFSSGDGGQGKKERAEQKAKREKRVVLGKVRNVAAAAMVEKSADESGKEFWKLLAALAVHTLSWEDAEVIMKRRAMGEDKRHDAVESLHEAVKTMSEKELRSFAVECLATRSAVNFYRAEFDEAFILACAHFKIDLKKLETQATPAEQPAKPKTKKRK